MRSGFALLHGHNRILERGPILRWKGDAPKGWRRICDLDSKLRFAIYSRSHVADRARLLLRTSPALELNLLSRCHPGGQGNESAMGVHNDRLRILAERPLRRFPGNRHGNAEDYSLAAAPAGIHAGGTGPSVHGLIQV